MRLILLITLLIIPNLLSAQQSNAISGPPKTIQIKDFTTQFISISTTETAQVIKRTLGGVRHFGQSKVTDGFQYGVIINKKPVVWLPEQESLIGALKTTMYTSRSAFPFDKTQKLEIKGYVLAGSSWKPTNKLVLDNQYYEVHLLESSNTLLVTDAWEGFGNKVELYGASLKKIAEYRPFKGEFAEQLWSADEQFVAIMSADSYQNHIQKVALIQQQTGKVLFDSLIDFGRQVPVGVHTTNGMVLVDTYEGDFPTRTFRTYAYTSQGRLRWSFDRTLTQQVAIKDQGKVWVVGYDGDTLICLNPETGQIRWQQPLPELATLPAGYQAIPSTFEATDDGEIQLVLTDHVRQPDGLYTILDSRYYQLSPEGKVIIRQPLGRTNGRVQVWKQNGKTQLFLSEPQKLITYEKKTTH